MDERGNGSLDKRVERLERNVEELRAELRHTLQRGGALDTEGASAPESALRRARSTRSTSSSVPETGAVRRQRPEGQASHGSGSGRSFELPFDLGDLRSGEWWLNKLGIGLLLFGVAFLFLLSVERGWITPTTRVGLGLAISATLLTVGLRVYENRRAFSQVLLGGGLGALYTTDFAAFQLYSLVPYLLAFAFMVAVTLLGCFLSFRQDEASLSVISALGGLGTPFLLYDDAGSLGGLVLYACLILAGTGAIYFYKGWASLLCVSFAGGWLVLLIGYLSGFSFWAASSFEDRWILQLGVIFVWLLFWIVPVAREVLRGSRGVIARLYTVTTSIVALGFTAAIWRFTSSEFGWITISGAALYALVALAFERLDDSRGLSRLHALVALLLLTHTLFLMLEGDVLFLTLAAEATILHLVARRFSDRIVSAGAHLLSSIAALWLANRLLPGILESFLNSAHSALFNARVLVDLAVIALTFGASVLVLPRNLSLAYRVVAHAALLALLWRELSALPGGDAWVTVAWGVYAVGLLVTGLRLDRASLVRGGMATLFLVVIKLFLVDLAEVEALWRVLLFLGFGGLFLALSYYLRSPWRPGFDESRDHGSCSAGDRS